MRFEPLTLVPVDLDAILPERMTHEEREMLNEYHKMCFRLYRLIWMKRSGYGLRYIPVLYRILWNERRKIRKNKKEQD